MANLRGVVITFYGTPDQAFDNTVAALSVFTGVVGVEQAQVYGGVPIWTLTIGYDADVVRLTSVLAIASLTGMVITGVLTESP